MIEDLSNLLEVSPRRIMLYVSRMLYELNLKRRITRTEEQKIFWRCSKRNWPWKFEGKLVKKIEQPESIKYKEKIIYYDNILSQKSIILNHDPETEAILSEAISFMEGLQ